MGLYTYEDFQKAVEKENLQDRFSDHDWKLAQRNADAGMGLLQAKKEYQSAGTKEAKAAANQRAEAIRRQYGNYSGGVTGGEYNLGPLRPISFPEEKKPEFSYTPEEDPVYQAYQKQYASQGRRATKEALGNAAAATGGIPSSYAVTAAAQAGNEYAGKMGDKIPQLFEQAYGRHQNDLSQYNKDREFGYGQYMDQLKNEQQASAAQWEQALQAAQTAGDFSLLQKLGVDTSGNPQEFQKKLEQARLALSAGDGKKLQELMGIQGDLQFDKNYKLAQLAASLGDYSLLEKNFGVNVDKDTVNSDMLLQLALARAKIGDYSYIDLLLGRYL